jgi:hypothetical protein
LGLLQSRPNRLKPKNAGSLDNKILSRPAGQNFMRDEKLF